jgi:putative NADH-flavin reductase
MEVIVMHVVMGASGNTGHIVASNLLARGEKVRVIGRNSTHLQALASKGAEPFISDVTDADALAEAFRGADSAYVMIPPNVTSKDPMGHSNRVSAPLPPPCKKRGPGTLSRSAASEPNCPAELVLS